LCAFGVPNMPAAGKPQNWLQNMIKSQLYKPPSAADRMRSADESRRDLDPGLIRVLKQRRHAKLKGEVDAWFCLRSSGMPRHLKAAERRYQSGAQQLWQALENTRKPKTLTELTGKRKLKLSRVQLYRVVERWAELGIAGVTPVKRSRHLDGRKEFLIKRTVPALPPICYTRPQK
ncbi:MAG: hypothetical protein KDK39_19865, partial [Leptospiraceae bacterium]|nr:hypothetical protein [Leptospiraceae bacterium]